MSKLDEIKQRFDQHERNFNLFDDDVQYLLSRIEIAERALERYANLHKLMYDDAVQGELYEHWWLRQSKHAIEALQQIRS